MTGGGLIKSEGHNGGDWSVKDDVLERACSITGVCFLNAVLKACRVELLTVVTDQLLLLGSLFAL